MNDNTKWSNLLIETIEWEAERRQAEKRKAKAEAKDKTIAHLFKKVIRLQTELRLQDEEMSRRSRSSTAATTSNPILHKPMTDPDKSNHLPVQSNSCPLPKMKIYQTKADIRQDSPKPPIPSLSSFLQSFVSSMNLYAQPTISTVTVNDMIVPRLPHKHYVTPYAIPAPRVVPLIPKPMPSPENSHENNDENANPSAKKPTIKDLKVNPVTAWWHRPESYWDALVEEMEKNNYRKGTAKFLIKSPIDGLVFQAKILANGVVKVHFTDDWIPLRKYIE